MGIFLYPFLSIIKGLPATGKKNPMSCLTKKFTELIPKQYGKNGRFYTDIFPTAYMPDAITLFI